MTPQKLIENATALNAKVSTEYEGQIGIQFKERKSGYANLWHWFEIYTFMSGETEVWFTHSYSQNNGSTKKGLRHRMNIESKLGFF